MKSRLAQARRALPMLALFAAWVSTAAQALPDLGRGLAAMERGDTPAAEADLVPLAEQGFAQAQIALGRMYAAQQTQESLIKSVHWLRIAATNDPGLNVSLARSLMRGGLAEPGEVDRLLKRATADKDAAAPALQLRLYREFPQLTDTAQAAQLAARVAMSTRPEDRAEAVAWYRANSAQPAHAQTLLKLCEKHRSEIEECYVDLSRHFRAINDQAAQAKLNQEVLDRFERKLLLPETLERIARSLSADDLAGTPASGVAYAMLKKITQPSPTVIARMARLLMADANLDPKADPEALLKTAHEQGSLEAALYLGRMYFDERNPKADPARAERLLAEAARSLPAAHVSLGRMYERGVDGQMDARRALTHYLLAARAGHANADMALARMYWSNRGVKVDPVNAYAFTRLAIHGATPGANELLATLRAALTPEQIAQGQRLAEREFAARKAAAGEPSTGVAANPINDPITTAEIKTP